MLPPAAAPRGREKLSSNIWFIASRKLTISPHGSHREMLISFILLEPERRLV
jgi:hypothetical protein